MISKFPVINSTPTEEQLRNLPEWAFWSYGAFLGIMGVMLYGMFFIFAMQLLNDPWESNWIKTSHWPKWVKILISLSWPLFIGPVFVVGFFWICYQISKEIIKIFRS